MGADGMITMFNGCFLRELGLNPKKLRRKVYVMEHNSLGLILGLGYQISGRISKQIIQHSHNLLFSLFFLMV